MIELAPNSKNRMSYDEALLYCQFLEYNGHRDWRMPTYQEYRGDDRLFGWTVGLFWMMNGKDLVMDDYVTPVRDI